MHQLMNIKILRLTFRLCDIPPLNLIIAILIINAYPISNALPELSQKSFQCIPGKLLSYSGISPISS